MKVEVQAKDMRVTVAIRNFVNKQISKLEKFSQQLVGTKVFLENLQRKTGDTHRSIAKMKVELPGKDLLVKSVSSDIYTSIRQVVRNASRHLRKRVEKIRQAKRKV